MTLACSIASLRHGLKAKSKPPYVGPLDTILDTWLSGLLSFRLREYVDCRLLGFDVNFFPFLNFLFIDLLSETFNSFIGVSFVVLN